MCQLFLRVEALPGVKLQLEPATIWALPARIHPLVLRIVEPAVLAVSHCVSGRFQSLPDMVVTGHVLFASETKGVPNRIIYHRYSLSDAGPFFRRHLVGDLLLQAVGALEAVVEAD